MAKKLIRDYAFTPGIAGVGTVKIPGKYTLDQLLLITNVTDNIILYSFGNTTYAGTSALFVSGNDAVNFPTIAQRQDGYTTITLATNTATQSSTDKLQIFVDETENTGVIVRPWSFGTDAIERMRVSNPESLIDADFEYGLQPTKWAGYGTVRGYPSAYDLPGVDLTVTNITTGNESSNSVITVTFSAPHGIVAGEVVNVSGLLRTAANYSRADGNFIVNTVNIPNTSTLTYLARGNVGVASGGSLLSSLTIVKKAQLYANASILVTSSVSNGLSPSTMTINTTAPHGLIPGTSIHVTTTGGTFPELATGPFIVLTVPSTTSFTYLARTGGAVASPTGTTLYAISNSLILHRAADGGVILETRSPTYGATVIRQSKKYFRYQSGKGFLFSTGTLLKPNYDILSMTASGTASGSPITVTTDDISHGLQVGATVRIEGSLTSGYNGTYAVASITGDYSFTVTSTTALGATTAVLDVESKVYVTDWHGAVVRAGVFDDQNGVFWEYNGSILSVVKRSSTFQITGTVATTFNSNTITGTTTRFTQQLRVGDKIAIRGMTHYVANVISDTSLTVTPDYRGITATGIRANLIREVKVKQSDFNLDTVDGTGPSGFTIDLNKMQMLGLQYSWYGAGFIDFMVRGSDGNWVFVHRMKNNNINNEAYMRSGNLPVRYSIDNDGANSYLTGAITNVQNTVPLADLTYFPSAGTVYIDTELVRYTGKSATTGAGNLTGCVRGTTMSQYQAGTTNVLNTSIAAASHSIGVGVILVSNTCSPTLSHWGSALIMDGGFTKDRGYIFNYQRIGMSLTTTNQTAFVIRLAPSVENSQVGLLGEKGLLNRSQLLLNAIGIAVSGGTNPGAVIVEGVLNPKNFSTATWSALSTEALGGQPSFSQFSQTITWSSGTFAVPGEQVFAFAGPTQGGAAGSTSDRLDLEQLKELTGAPLGGDFKYPDGPDILAVNVRLTGGTATGHVLLRWSEAQA